MSKPKYAFGITSQTQDNSHIFMSDIDKEIGKEEIKKICDYIQWTFGLSDIYVSKSHHGWNMFSLDKLPLRHVYTINKMSHFIDKQYNELQYNNRKFYTLRTLPRDDKIFSFINRSGNNLFAKSNGHRIFFTEFFDLHIEKDDLFDDSEIVTLIRYRNKKYGWYMNETE